MNEASFTVEQARSLLPTLLAWTDELVALRADLTELTADLRAKRSSTLGGAADAKGYEARISELAGFISERGIEVKGLAPVLLDFPATLDGQSVRLCWLEGERELGWYHRTDLGFACRRPL